MPTYLMVIVVVSIVGLIDTLYLTYHALTKTDVKCLFFPKEWCQKVQYSKYSKTFGIPNPFLGLGMYLAILALSFAFNSGLVPFWPLSFIITFGFLFSLYFTYIQAFVLRAFCTWCVVSALNFVILFCSVYFLR